MSKSKNRKVIKYYWDACVFLAAITGENERKPIIKSMLEKGENGDIEIYTSLLSVTEVAFARNEKEFHKLDPEIENSINELWAPTSPVKVVEFYDLIAWGAKDLMRKVIPNGWSIKPADAIHLITAQQMEVDEFHTYDKPVINKHKDKLIDWLGFNIKEPETEPMLFNGLDESKEKLE